MSGVETRGGRTNNLLILSSLLNSLGQRESGSDAKVDFLVQKAVFVTDHELCFGVILSNEQAQSASVLRDIEDEIGGVRLSGPQWLSRNRVRQSAARALSRVKFFHRSFEVGGGEVRPALWKKNKLCERALPQQKIGEALLAPGADEQIHFG